MFNGEKLLGSLIRGAVSSSFGTTRRRRRSYSRSGFGTGALERAIGTGLVGLAIAAYEHYSQGKARQPAAGISPAPSPVPPSAAPPPPPMKASVSPPPPPAPTASDPTATLLIKTMFAAASADGTIDEDERRGILEHMSSAGLTPEETTFLEQQMDNPLKLDDVIHEARRAGFAESLRHQIFFVSLLAIAVDTPEEARYVEELRQALAISPEKAKEIAAQFETNS